MRALLLPLLAGCGGLGLDAMEDGVLLGSAEDPSAESALEEGPAPVQADLVGRTYAAALDELVVTEPSGLAPFLAGMDADALLFHVTDESEGALGLALTLSDASGRQSACEPVVALPAADWSDNPLFFIEEGRFSLPIGGQDVAMRKLTMAGEIAPDGASWPDAVLSAEIDTRELVGGSLPEGTDACALVEQMGGSCHACSDGTVACATLEMELAPVEVEIPFDAGVTGEGC